MPLMTPHLCAAVDDLRVRHHLPFLLLAAAHGADDPEVVTLGSSAQGAPLSDDSLFPVASVTKLATALAVLRLAAEGTIALDDPLAVHLPQAAASVEGVTLRSLLCHSSGLPDDVAAQLAPYAPGLTWRQLGQACLATPLLRSPGSRVTYSNVGYGLLALLVEARTGQPFAAALADLVLEPLGVEGYLGVEPPRAPAAVAGKLGEHAGTALEPFNSPFWRSLAMPWAGLVTNVAGALALVRAFAGVPAAFLPAALRRAAVSSQTGDLPGGFTGFQEWPLCPWGLGVELRGGKTPHMVAPTLSPVSFGHSGYSGCLAWADPAAGGGTGAAWALLGGPRVFSGWRSFWQPLSALLTMGDAAV